MFYIIIALILIVNTYLTNYLSNIEGLILVLHILKFFTILISVTYLALHNSASEVFKTFINSDSYSSDDLSLFIKLVASVYAFINKLIKSSLNELQLLMYEQTLTVLLT